MCGALRLAIMKVFVLGNDARSMRLFWSPLLLAIREHGHDVYACVPSASGKNIGESAQEQERLERLCHGVHCYPLDRRGMKFWREGASLMALVRLIHKEKPDILFASTVKTVIYTGIAGALAQKRPRFFACITGLGYCFEGKSVWRRAFRACIEFLYRQALKKAEKVFFQNKEDEALFEKARMLSCASVLCRGTGVDTRHFAYSRHFPAQPTFLLMARLLPSKGIEAFVEAARILRASYPHARFHLLGPEERGGIPMKTVQQWHDAGHIEYLGFADDVRPYIVGACVMVLPSWREGTPCAILEGMSMGRAAVVSDVVGCREVVRHGVNGFLVPSSLQGEHPVLVQNLATAMEYFIKTPSLIISMGAAGRRMAEEIFDGQKVAQTFVRHMGL